eukprot:c4441_g1_i1.p1 GENE.c4441_g1_i1~~c4441_g1_i1.p1  ORF type:complete len:754 (-),score=211.89 c4441_g1_i1:165-2396(-)
MQAYTPYPPIPSRQGHKKEQQQQPQLQPQQQQISTPPQSSEETGQLTTQQKFDLILSVGEECVTKEELNNLITKKPDFRLYDGFEPSGRMHIAQGVFKAVNVNKCTKAGGIFVFWVADWFALMNGKMGGDLDKIQTVGQYFIEVWKASGMDMSRVQFAWAADEITKHAEKYWTLALDVGRRFTLARVKKCCQIMGRKEDNLTAAQILYPLMQCTDIFFLNANICQLGVDQRKVNMLAREYCDMAGIKLKPIILSHHMLYGLGAGQQKMSKSQPDSAIFMEDTEEDVRRKIMKAYCPLKPEAIKPKDDEESMHLVEDDLKNPCLDYVQHIVLSRPGAEFNAGTHKYTSFANVKQDFIGGKLSENDLKEGLITAVNKLIEPVRQHFQNDANAREILHKVREFKKEDENNQGKVAAFTCLRTQQNKDTTLIFAPLPTANLSLAVVLDLLLLIRSNSSPIVLWLPNWSAYARSALDGDLKAIDAWYTLLVESLRAISPADMERVKVLLQSETILKDSGNYWISVINVGREFAVSRILQADPTITQAGQVVACMMHVADVLAIAPARVLGHPSQKLLHELAAEYIDKIQGVPQAPQKTVVAAVDDHDLRLKPHSETALAIEDPDNEIFVSDLPADIKRKIKSAFCEPGNATSCPPLVFAEVANTVSSIGIEISRKEENGGNLSYKTTEKMRTDFASGALHPGDLKPAVAKLLDQVVQKVRDHSKNSEDLKKAENTLKNFAKQQAKKKK